MAKDGNGKELKVGDKVRALTDGGYGDTFKVGEIYEVTAMSKVSDKGVKIGQDELFMHHFEIELVEEEVKEEVNMQEPKLTPKLIESLDELQVGDYFRTKYGEVINVMSVDKSCDYSIATDASAYNLAELQEMGAYKVKVEPLEMVEVEEVKPKLYELVEGASYVKLERGDIIKFKDGNVHGVHAVDEDDNVAPYCMYFLGDSWWVESHYFLPENIISINGINIHEDYVGDAEITADPYEGWVEGAKVKCLKTKGGYEEDDTYALGWCDCGDTDFGVRNGKGLVLSIGCLISDVKTYVNEDILDYFELIKE